MPGVTSLSVLFLLLALCPLDVAAQCPSPVSVTEYNQFAKDLRDCRSLYLAKTGKKLSFPDFHPYPACKLIGVNLHARLMEFRIKFCNASLSSLGDPSITPPP